MGTTPMDSNSLRILLIDDNPHGLRARKALLAKLGYSVSTASCGKAGLAKLEQEGVKQKGLAPEGFDLVVTDYRMPDLQGTELIAGIRDLDETVPILVLSGYVAKLGLTKEDIGVDLVVAKGPNEHRDLARAVVRLTQPAPKKPRSEKGRAPTTRRRAAGA